MHWSLLTSPVFRIVTHMNTQRKPRGPVQGRNDPDPKKTGQNLREARIARGVTQREMAEALGYSAHNGVTHLEAGTRILSDTDLRVAADFLGIAPSVIRQSVKAAR